jgi:hypothetical protein
MGCSGWLLKLPAGFKKFDQAGPDRFRAMDFICLCKSDRYCNNENTVWDFDFSGNL